MSEEFQEALGSWFNAKREAHAGQARTLARRAGVDNGI